MEKYDKVTIGRAKGLLTSLQKKDVDFYSGFVLTGSLGDEGYAFTGHAFGDDFLQYRAFLEFFLQSPKVARLLALALMRYETVSDDFSFEDMNTYNEALSVLVDLGEAIKRAIDERELYARALDQVYDLTGHDAEVIKANFEKSDDYLAMLKETYSTLEEHLVTTVIGGDA